MPRPKSPEFRPRTVGLARSGQQPDARIASDLGISESCLRRWIAQDDVDAGRREGLRTGERRELVELRRRNRVPNMEIDLRKRASGYFARGERPPLMTAQLVQEPAVDAARRGDLPGAGVKSLEVDAPIAVKRPVVG